MGCCQALTTVASTMQHAHTRSLQPAGPVWTCEALVASCLPVDWGEPWLLGCYWSDRRLQLSSGTKE